MIIWSILGIILLVAIDQFSKWMIVFSVKPNGPITIIDGLLQFVYVENRGAAFGIMQNKQWFFVVLTIAACAVLLYFLFFYKHHNFFSRTACLLIVAGGIGNLIDRIKLSYVIDFISVSFFPPVFNFADICICVGVGLLVLSLLLDMVREQKAKQQKGSAPTDGTA